MQTPSTFVATVDLSVADKLRKELIQRGFEISHPPHTLFSAKSKGISCTLYKSGKLTVQGKEMGPFIEFFLEPEILGSFKYAYQAIEVDKTARIGIDESGKGDFFGPLCIAGVYAQGEDLDKLVKLGVRDSKKLTDGSIAKIAKQIRTSIVHHIVKINPAKYNELYGQFHNLNRLLAWGHATAIEQLSLRTKCQNVIIDQFADEHVVLTALKRKNISLELTQRHRGEEDLVVAAASILARYTFVEGLKSLSEQWGLDLPKGASKATIEAARAFVRQHGRESLGQVAKLHFKTANEL
ncbi:MAG: ribonuclease HIII [Parachlamydia sp.]|nr:ribonuclease HIII [Parachlamydia sp.]